MDTLNKSATQIMAEANDTSQCCALWRGYVNGIKITARGETASERTQADILEKLFKFQMGNFCPTCGNKL